MTERSHTEKWAKKLRFAVDRYAKSGSRVVRPAKYIMTAGNARARRPEIVSFPV
jgi:hypothetical protein